MLIFKKYYDNYFIARLEVEESQGGTRLDQFVGDYLSSHSREQVKKKIKAKECLVTNRSCSNKSSTKLKYRDIVEITINKTSHEDEYWRGELLSLGKPEIIYENKELLVINKPPFMSTHPTGKHLFNCATVFFENKLNLDTIHSIHRLDRETSGILLLAKNPKCANQLTVEFEKSNVKKCYLWIAKHQGDPIIKPFIADENLNNPYPGLKRVIVEANSKISRVGKHAKTSFHPIESTDDYTVGLAFPETGRTHQIRVHAKEHGFPLVGDKLYLGGYPLFQRFKDNIYTDQDCIDVISPRHYLHAFALKIQYRDNFETFFSPMSNDMQIFYKKFFNKDPNNLIKVASEIVTGHFNVK